MKQIPSEVLVNPKPKQIEAALAAADVQANPPKAKARTCHFPADLAKKIRNCKEGIYEDDGGAVANSYKYTAETSHVLAAWWTSGNGTRYVRIIGGRTQARKASHGSGNGCPHCSCTPWAAVFTLRAMELSMAGMNRALLAILRCGEWPHWNAPDALVLAATRVANPSRMGRVNDLLELAKRLLPDKLRTQSLSLVAVSPVGVIVRIKQGQAYVVARQTEPDKFCELLPVSPRFADRERTLMSDAEMVEAAMDYVRKKDPRLDTEYAPQV